MPTQEPVAPKNGESMTPLEYLARADKEMASGNGRAAAGLLWKATQTTLLNLAQERGYHSATSGDDTLIELACAMENPGPNPGYHYRGKVAAGSLLREHAHLDVLEECELESAYQVARQFVMDWNGEPE